MKLDSEELLKKGEECEKRGSIDSALVLYSLVTKIAYEPDDKAEIKICCKAYNFKSMVYFSYFYDYTKAYENLMSALELKNDYNIDYPMVDNTAAVFYHVIAVICRNWDMERKAMEYCIKAYYNALKHGERNSMHQMFSNIILMSCNLNENNLTDKLWKTYRNDEDSSFDYRFNKIFYDYLIYNNKKQYDKAIDAAVKMLDISVKSGDRQRINISYSSLIQANENKGEYKKALFYVEEKEKLAKEWNMHEMLIELLNTKENIYRKTGNTELADKYSRLYYQQKDSLLNLTQISNICRAQYNSKSRKMEKVIEDVTIENKVYNKMFLITLIFVIVLVIMVVMLFRKIKQLKKSNITIYENNEKIFENEEKERLKLREEVLKIQDVDVEELKKVESCKLEDKEINEDDVDLTEEDKYKKNVISDEEKKKILDKILTVMENVDEICSESFSGARLAELTGYKYNYVSLVINENYGCNFNTLLNKFRVKEACRRLADDKNYGNYTIDAIANSLGFKSRTTLTTSFKKIVGLTPSQYRTIAKEKKLE